MPITREIRDVFLSQIKTIFETEEFQNSRILVISIPSQNSGALGIDTTQLHSISNDSTKYHHSALYKNDSKIGRRNVFDDIARQLRQQEIMISVSNSTWTRWHTTVTRSRIRTESVQFSLRKIPKKVFLREKESIFQQLSEIMKYVTTIPTYTTSSSQY